MTVSQSAWRSAPCSLSLSCNGLTLPCSQISKRTCSWNSEEHEEREEFHHCRTEPRRYFNRSIVEQQQYVLKPVVRESVFPGTTRCTDVSSSKLSWWRWTLQLSDPSRPAESCAGTWRGRPWASTNERVTQAIPEGTHQTLWYINGLVMRSRRHQPRPRFCQNFIY